MIDAGRQSDGLFDLNDVLPTMLALAGETGRLPHDRYIDGIDQSSFILAPYGLSNRKYHYYWLTTNFSALRYSDIDGADGDER
jgi:arylsulfatase